ncbi:endonuclease/exonuclease/phosphatase family protein [Maribacter arcticus]|uniref:Metal-dependent hydrolase, endonuclease/exonuclease/phosphatase family n=1 Tax=Maribacter arcticus TaxID=561365 RepID=A0A1T5BKH5_9FLAO|nr:endonuclease/exonuclease/phosphatase family protein [Maribacter arcticus]SKB47665.1 Metal-dependent hydrolase, endonuclease/exonuclease/phosphatase family [Maribacter arcticus]
MKKLSFFSKIMLLVNMIFSFCLLLACIIPYTSSASLAFVSLAVPLLVFINILFFIYWLLRKKFYFLLSLSILVYGYLTLGTFIGFNSINKTINNEDSLSIMSFNSLGFQGKKHEWESTAGDTIVKFIQNERPDIVCFQEFDYKKIRSHYFEEYPFKYVDFEFGPDNGRVIQAVYSRHKILEKGILDFPESSNSAIFVDVKYMGDTIRIYNLHLESLNIRPNNIKKERSDKLFGRLRHSFAKQQEQSTIVREHLNNSPYKNIVCGDFNNTQFSNSYFTIKGNLKDSFLEKGRGYGKTINFWKFPFRIDFVLVDPSLEVLSHKNYNINLSDHEPIMATIKILSE